MSYKFQILLSLLIGCYGAVYPNNRIEGKIEIGHWTGSLMCLANFLFKHKFAATDAEFWQNSARNYLRKVLAMNPASTDIGIARNVILFIGDGMGMSTITAARMFKGQLQGRAGEEEQLSFDMFPNVGLAKVSGIMYKHYFNFCNSWLLFRFFFVFSLFFWLLIVFLCHSNT